MYDRLVKCYFHGIPWYHPHHGQETKECSMNPLCTLCFKKECTCLINIEGESTWWIEWHIKNGEEHKFVRLRNEEPGPIKFKKAYLKHKVQKEING